MPVTGMARDLVRTVGVASHRGRRRGARGLHHWARPGGNGPGTGRAVGAVLGLVVTVAGGGAVVMMVEKIPRNLATVAVGPSATGRGRHRATVTVKVAHTVRVGRSASLDSFK